VSKRLGSRYTSDRTRDWLKFKNPNAPAVKREAEEEWGKGTMAVARTHFTYRIDMWTDDEKEVVEHLPTSRT
jgi:ATP-dependent DNA ligase